MKKKLLSFGLAAMMLLTGCSSGGSSASSTASAKYKAGTYTATAQGHNGDVTVEVVFTDDAIQSVTVTDQQETEAIASNALKDIPDEIVDQQSTDVEAVSGATVTSTAIIDAVNDCIKQAGGTVETSSGKEEKEKTQETASTDVLVIGGGMAGMSAALAAKDAGVDVVLLEKAGQLGGTVNVAGGYLVSVDAEAFKDSDAPDSLEETEKAWSEHMAYSGQDSGYPDQDRLEYVLKGTGSTVDWLAEKGVEWDAEPFTGFDGGTYTCAHDVDNGPGIVEQLTKTIEDDGIDVKLNTTATALVIDDDGSVTGAVAEDDDTITTYTAKAVILTTGGYANNEEMLKKYAPKLAAVNTVSGAAATDTGDGFTMAEKAGADFFADGTGFGSLWATQVEPDALKADQDLSNLSFAKALGVDGSGKRFANEAPNVPYMDATASDMIQNGNGPFWYIFDSSDADTEKLLSAGVDSGAVKTADTIADLAGEIDVDADALQSAYDTYNSAAESGNDEEFHKAADNMTALTKAPYYAVQFVPTTFGSTGGVKTDESQHVLNTDGEVIKGLFAAGEMSNRYFYNENYMLGASLGLYATCGRTAGTTAAADAK